ncbi:hypothetical protein [Candidatus Protofrankia californiensis]|uniref:hypothetical protein n=1 Tax=Candidatus Protofrankia californiensis TaxID=1839754 RepID=UPI0010419009|nr:hypothetical protein [Candidatus Protofrankia californiensis]
MGGRGGNVHTGIDVATSGGKPVRGQPDAGAVPHPGWMREDSAFSEAVTFLRPSQTIFGKEFGLAHRSLPYAFALTGEPSHEVFCELTAPGGGTWRYGPPNAESTVTGPAGDFCSGNPLVPGSAV